MRVSTSSYACIFLRMRVKRKLHVCVLDPILGTEKQGTDALGWFFKTNTLFVTILTHISQFWFFSPRGWKKFFNDLLVARQSCHVLVAGHAKN